VVKGEPEYERGVDLLHGDVNAAVEGAFDAGADEVLVNDSHSTMRNLDRARLDGRATLIRGNTKPRSMVQGLQSAHDVALFVGYHAKMGTPAAVLNHTVLGHELQSLHVDGEEVGEMGWNARFAGALGVPVGLVTGDDATAEEAVAEVPDAERVIVKEAIDRFSAACRPGSETRPRIREGASRAVERAGDGTLGLTTASTPVTMTATWATTQEAEEASRLPGVERVDGRQTAVTGEEYVTAFEATVAMLRAGGRAADQYYG
jgi:D-amino peptidase